MGKINELIKLGLPEAMAKKVEQEIQISGLFDIKLNQWKSTKQDIIDKIVQSEPDFKTIPVSTNDDSLYLESKECKWTNQKITGYVIDLESKIKKVKFIIGAETLTIDDPIIIELLRKSLIGAKVQPTKNKHRPTSTQKKILKKLGLEIMTYSNEASNYGKYHFLEKVYKIYLPNITYDTIKKWY